ARDIAFFLRPALDAKAEAALDCSGLRRNARLGLVLRLAEIFPQYLAQRLGYRTPKPIEICDGFFNSLDDDVHKSGKRYFCCNIILSGVGSVIAAIDCEPPSSERPLMPNWSRWKKNKNACSAAIMRKSSGTFSPWPVTKPLVI